MDTTRWDVLSCYNAPEVQTPNIGAFARANTVFENCYSSASVTLPSHAAMLTGMTPPDVGILDNNHYTLTGDYLTLAEILKAKGFHTAAFVSSFVLDSRFGLDQGFDTYDDHVEAGIGIDERRGDATTDSAIDWLDQNKARRNFLFVHYYDPHAPYSPPEPFASQFAQIYGEYPEFIQQYVGEIAFMDECIGRLLTRLKALDLYDRSMIILTADHGESHEEHGEFTHGFFIYNSTIKVPLIVKLPGQNRSNRVETPVGLVDILPTVCSVLGIDLNRNFRGIDLSDYLRATARSHTERTIFSFSIEPQKYRGNPVLGLIYGDYKYIHTTKPELYNISNDVYERRDRINIEPAVASQLHEKLGHILDDIELEHADNRIELDMNTARRLQALGYVGTTEPIGHFRIDPSARDPKDLIEYHELHLTALKYVNPDLRREALSAAESMIEMRPDLFNGYVMKGKILISMGQRDDAVPFLKKAAELDPDGTRAQLQTVRAHDPAG